MNMFDAIETCFRKYADFDGRASRKEFWYFWLFFVIVDYVISLTRTPVLTIVVLAIWIPLLAVNARRLHDSNHSAWWMLCPIYNIVLYCQPSQPQLT